MAKKNGQIDKNATMSQKLVHQVDEDTIKIKKLDVFSNNAYKGITINWTSNIGFGQYTIYSEPDSETWNWYGISEYIDSNADKSFLKMLLKKFADDVIIDE